MIILIRTITTINEMIIKNNDHIYLEACFSWILEEIQKCIEYRYVIRVASHAIVIKRDNLKYNVYHNCSLFYQHV